MVDELPQQVPVDEAGELDVPVEDTPPAVKKTYRSTDKTAEVSGAGPNGEEVRVSFSKGTYTTTDAVEQYVLDGVAAWDEHPVTLEKEE